jgi:hypothetical protein
MVFNSKRKTPIREQMSLSLRVVREGLFNAIIRGIIFADDVDFFFQKKATFFIDTY